MIFIEVKEDLPELQDKLEEAKKYIEKEARANNLWPAFENMTDEQWLFVASLLIRFNER